ncbi:helix-turn-helix domain-containing protein [Streptomyces radicis]|uniref:helix-turn-helix domain-containing protein n=1 Tax=Streptomyces radicis TaxID=1750517 RepID=UPI0038B62DD4
MASSSSVQQAREALGKRLREIRKDSGLTARELASRAGWHESKCSRIENGPTGPSDDDLRSWALHCGAHCPSGRWRTAESTTAGPCPPRPPRPPARRWRRGRQVAPETDGPARQRRRQRPGGAWEMAIRRDRGVTGRGGWRCPGAGRCRRCPP